MVEDNAGGNAEARELKEEYRRKYNIRNAPHLQKSADLNMIEGLWDYQRDGDEEYPVFGGSSARSKHISVWNYYTRDLIQRGGIKLEYKISREMIVDGLTKPLEAIGSQKVCRTNGA